MLEDEEELLLDYDDEGVVELLPADDWAEVDDAEVDEVEGDGAAVPAEDAVEVDELLEDAAAVLEAELDAGVVEVPDDVDDAAAPSEDAPWVV